MQDTGIGVRDKAFIHKEIIFKERKTRKQPVTKQYARAVIEAVPDTIGTEGKKDSLLWWTPRKASQGEDQPRDNTQWYSL